MTSTNSDDRSPNAGRRTIYSLRTLILLTTAIAVWVPGVIAHYAAKGLTASNASMRLASQDFQIDDPEELTARRMPNLIRNWEVWKVHIPASRPYRVCLAAGELSPLGDPSDHPSRELPPGRHEVALKIDRQDRHRWECWIDGQRWTDVEHAPAIPINGGYSQQGVRTETSSTASPGERLMLDDVRAMRKGLGMSNVGEDENYFGHRLWIEPVDAERLSTAD